jgi:hypothetical protein
MQWVYNLNPRVLECIDGCHPQYLVFRVKLVISKKHVTVRYSSVLPSQVTLELVPHPSVQTAKECRSRVSMSVNFVQSHTGHD